jgi:hypothetical protein
MTPFMGGMMPQFMGGGHGPFNPMAAIAQGMMAAMAQGEALSY